MTEARWRQHLVNAWYSGARWLLLLRPLEWLYRAVSAMRRRLYQWRVLRSYRFSAPVVVVGNITVGGTGKTPFVVAMVQALAQQGIRAGVVARGYGAALDQKPRVVTLESPAAEVGDEAVLIFRRTGCPCVVHHDRVKAVQHLLSHFNVDVVLCDDGLQHYAMGRDMEVIVYDVERGFGNGRCLPAGPLREPLARLAQADFVLGRGFDSNTADVVLSPGALINLHSGENVSHGHFVGRGKIDAVAGIANPYQFAATLQRLGIDHELHVFRDHHAYTAADFDGFDARPIIMTEKDAVKCLSLAGPDAWYLQLDARVPERVLEQVVRLVRH